MFSLTALNILINCVAMYILAFSNPGNLSMCFSVLHTEVHDLWTRDQTRNNPFVCRGIRLFIR